MKDFTSSEITELSEKITHHFFKEFTITNQDIHIYKTKNESHEVHTNFLIDKLLKEFPVTTLITSISNFENYSMSHYIFDENTIFQDNKQGIPEPLNGIYYNRVPDIIIIPLLGYDKKGNRVGFGKGFYDRFLASCPTSFKVGLSLLPPVELIEDTDAWDIQLDYCVNPTGVLTF